ncbi:MAG: alpha/beta hydrolase [Terricaulis sp.]
MRDSQAGRGQQIRALEIETNYHDSGGDGPVIVLLHGSGPGVSAWTNWKRVMPALAERARIIAPDLPGFGFTERKPDAHYDIKLWSKHLLAFLDALSLPRVSLVGNSFGGSLALAASARFADRFERLVLMGTPCGSFVMTPGLRAGWDYTPSREAMRATMAHFPFDPAIITDELVEDRYQASLISGAQEGLRKLLVEPSAEGDTLLSGMPEQVVAGITTPALVLHGREDKVIPVDMGVKLASAMPRADLHVFARCGHWVQAERFDEFVALTSRFLIGGDNER